MKVFILMRNVWCEFDEISGISHSEAACLTAA